MAWMNEYFISYVVVKLYDIVWLSYLLSAIVCKNTVWIR